MVESRLTAKGPQSAGGRSGAAGMIGLGCPGLRRHDWDDEWDHGAANESSAAQLATE
jgi:hypothetical protein